MPVAELTLTNSLASRSQPTLPVSVVSRWQRIANTINTADDTTLNQPLTQITADTRTLFSRDSQQTGTSLMFRVGVPSGLTSLTNPVMRVFGRKQDSGDAFQMLQNLNEQFDITFDLGNNTTIEGGVRYSSPTKAHIVDMASCDEFLAGIKTALGAGGGTGTIADAFIEVKVL